MIGSVVTKITRDEEPHLVTMDKDVSKTFNKLVFISNGISLKEHIDSLEERKAARGTLTKCMQYPIKIVEERFAQLTLNDRPVKACEYTCEIDLYALTDELLKFDNNFDPAIQNKIQLKEMPKIEEFFH